jgi:hypothetical protein
MSARIESATGTSGVGGAGGGAAGGEHGMPKIIGMDTVFASFRIAILRFACNAFARGHPDKDDVCFGPPSGLTERGCAERLQQSESGSYRCRLIIAARVGKMTSLLADSLPHPNI